MLGVDQFNNDWSMPFQGLVYPAWGGSGHAGGTFWAPPEQALLRAYASQGCPSVSNGSFIPDTGACCW